MRVAVLASVPLHVLPLYRDAGEPKGHYATWFPQLICAFSGSGPLEIHWVTLSPEVSQPKVVTFCNQCFHILPTSTSKRASTFFRADRAIIKTTLQSVSPDLVHGWGNEDVYGLAAATSGFPNIVSIQGLLSYYALKNRLPLRTYFQCLIELYVINRADRLICESLWACDMTRRFLLRRTTPIHHVEYGVQPCFFEEPWNPSPDKPVAVFTGSADPRKGIQDLIAAFRDPRLASAELWVLGSDTTEFAMRQKKLASPNVRWFGRLPIGESVKKLAQGWCFVLLTRADTGPMAVKEARSVGLPVISSPNSGARDYIRDGENGFLVRPGDVSRLTDRLVHLLGNYELCRRMGENQQESDRNEFRAARTADRLSKLYLIDHAHAAK